MSTASSQERLGTLARSVSYQYSTESAVWAVSWHSVAFPGGCTVVHPSWDEVWSRAVQTELAGRNNDAIAHGPTWPPPDDLRGLARYENGIASDSEEGGL